MCHLFFTWRPLEKEQHGVWFLLTAVRSEALPLPETKTESPCLPGAFCLSQQYIRCVPSVGLPFSSEGDILFGSFQNFEFLLSDCAQVFSLVYFWMVYGSTCLLSPQAGACLVLTCHWAWMARHWPPSLSSNPHLHREALFKKNNNILQNEFLKIISHFNCFIISARRAWWGWAVT